jgi:hypothetical protein
VFACIRWEALPPRQALALLAHPDEVSPPATFAAEDSSEEAGSRRVTRTERAALDQRAGTRRDGLTQVPGRARALASAATTLLGLDWRMVPAATRATRREQIALLEQALAAAQTALGEGESRGRI